MERCALFWLQRSFKIQFGTRNFPRRWATLDARTAGNVIETLIAQHDSVSLNFVIKAAAAPLPASPPHFKNVSEIGADIDAHRNYQGRKSVVHDFDFFVAHALPQKSRTQHVDGVAWNFHLIVAQQVDVGEIGGEENIVSLNCRAEQQRARSPHVDHKLRQEPCALEENPFLAASAKADVTVTVKHGKHLAVFQDTREVVSRRVPGSYVVLLGDANFIQLRTPSESSTGAGLPLSTR